MRYHYSIRPYLDQLVKVLVNCEFLSLDASYKCMKKLTNVYGKAVCECLQSIVGADGLIRLGSWVLISVIQRKLLMMRPFSASNGMFQFDSCLWQGARNALCSLLWCESSRHLMLMEWHWSGSSTLMELISLQNCQCNWKSTTGCSRRTQESIWQWIMMQQRL